MKNLMNKEWWIAALFRAFKTFCQGLLILIGSDQVGFLEVDWMHSISIAGMMALSSILTSVAGLPEVSDVDYQETEYIPYFDDYEEGDE
ncbi:holin [Solibacillus silvestris]